MRDKLIEFYRRNKYAVCCAAIGLVFAILILAINFWRTLLLLTLVLIGFAIGRGYDSGKTFLQMVYDFYEKFFRKK